MNSEVINLGYIPPFRDEQPFQYGNRNIYSQRGIKQVSPVLKGSFQRVLAEEERKAFYQQSKNKHKHPKEKSHKMISKLTGKGTYVDEVV